MKAFWKILGLGALAVGLTPYKVEKNEETGEKSYQALLWKGTVGPGSGEDKKNIDINLGEGTLTSMLMGGNKKAEEPHLFSDELCVEYTGGESEAADAVEEVVEEAAEAVEEVAEAVEAAAEEAVVVTEEAAEAVECAGETPDAPEAEEPKAE